MKKQLIFAILALCTIITLSAKNNLPPEEESVKKVVTEFIEGIDSRNADQVESTILDEGTFITTNLKNEVESFTSSELIANIRSKKLGGWKRNFEISSVELNDNIATAKVQFSTSKVKQFHVLSLILVDGQWKIASCCANMSKA